MQKETEKGGGGDGRIEAYEREGRRDDRNKERQKEGEEGQGRRGKWRR